MAGDHWTLETINWGAFDPARVDADLLKIVKAAAMVEFNAPDYVTYLCNVFADREDIKASIRQWGEEESQHGRALAAYAEKADPDFDFDKAFARFRKGYGIPIEAETSVRGSRAGEMVARCVVETGTSSFYSAIRDATDEPVLKEIAGYIAADEFRHYKLFFDTLETLNAEEWPSVLSRLLVALGRLGEVEDDELSYAYYAANMPEGSAVPYDRKAFGDAYQRRAFRLYQRRHTDRVVSMVAKAVGIAPQGHVVKALSVLTWGGWRFRQTRLASAA